MAKHPAGKGKGAQAPMPAPEKGICIICGEGRSGTPANPSIPIRVARWLRAALGQPAKHTIACSGHLGEAKAKRAKYDKKKSGYALGAILFFGFVMLGSLAYGKLDLGLAVPALIGAFFIALLPYFYYFPSFGE